MTDNISSYPSEPFVVADVPEVREFSGKFVYDYHVPNELIADDASHVPIEFVTMTTEGYDSKYIDLHAARVPRYVRLNFHNVVKFVKAANVKTAKKGFIRSNYKKIVVEYEFALQQYKFIAFQDQNLGIKLRDSAINRAMIASKQSGITSKPAVAMHRASSTLTALTGVEIKHFTNDKKNNGIVTQENRKAEFSKVDREIKSSLQTLETVKTRVHANAKFIDTIVKSAYYNASHTFSQDLAEFSRRAQSLETSERNRLRGLRADDVDIREYEHVIEPISIKAFDDANEVKYPDTVCKIVGYVVDKYEYKNGKYIPKEPIIIENYLASEMIDLKVKYGTTYAYQVRTIAEFDIPARTNNDQDIVATILISSKPTDKIFVECVERQAPPSPVELDCGWEHSTNNFTLRWTLPVNKQRDIKKFQIFRRRSIKEPFQLLHEYDFDDTVRDVSDTTLNIDGTHENLIKKMPFPKMSYYDDEFGKNSKYIYALVSVDAHGMQSGYSLQMQFSYNHISNKIDKNVISQAGAPKQYPNMFLNKDLFADLIDDERSSRMKLYFTPRNYTITNNGEKPVYSISTNKNGGNYKIQVMNLDLQQQKVINVTIDDKREISNSTDQQIGSNLVSRDVNEF